MPQKLFLGFGLNSVNPKFYGGTWTGWLNACVNDAGDMGALARSAGFEARAAFDEDCSKQNIRSEFTEANAKLGEGDSFWFHYSGHGSKRGSWSWGGFNEAFCLYDGEFLDTELMELAAGFAPGVRFILTLDCCFAAGMSRERGKYAARVKPFGINSKVEMPAMRGIKINASGIILSAATADEVAMDGDPNGAFTGALIDTKEKEPKFLTWESWIVAVQLYCAKFTPTQHPSLEKVGADADWNVVIADGN